MGERVMGKKKERGMRGQNYEKPSYGRDEEQENRRFEQGRINKENVEDERRNYGHGEEEGYGRKKYGDDDDERPNYGSGEEVSYGRKKYGDDNSGDEEKHGRHKHHHRKNYDDE